MTTESIPKGRKTKNGLRAVLGGNLLASERALKHLPFVFFLVFLGILLITNRYWAEKTIRQMEAVQDTIKELKAGSVTFEAELMKMNRPSEIAERVKESGLDLLEPQEPPRRLSVKKE
ncbi:MAG: FtsL-like putative cell division protein [Mangrovibacterium sp.]|nr:FtsL-like putative cell division protein [Mangrovibacterium sp.]